MNGVKFLMQDREVEVPCRATIELLAERFNSDGTPSGHELAFLLHREEIEQAASTKFDDGNVEAHVDPKVVIAPRDMASPLSRKFEN